MLYKRFGKLSVIDVAPSYKITSKKPEKSHLEKDGRVYAIVG
jgi:hypothetical protein